MTERQRRTHLLIWLVAGPLALALIVLAAVGRPAPPAPPTAVEAAP